VDSADVPASGESLEEYLPSEAGVNTPRANRSDSVKRHLPIGYTTDLTPVVAAKEAEVSWNALGMAETV